MLRALYDSIAPLLKAVEDSMDGVGSFGGACASVHASHNSCGLVWAARTTLQRSISHCPGNCPDSMQGRCNIREAISLGSPYRCLSSVVLFRRVVGLAWAA